MMIHRKLSLALCTSFLAIMLSGCEQEGPAEQAGEEIDKAAEEASEAMKEAGEKLEETTQ